MRDHWLAKFSERLKLIGPFCFSLLKVQTAHAPFQPLTPLNVHQLGMRFHATTILARNL